MSEFELTILHNIEALRMTRIFKLSIIALLASFRYTIQTGTAFIPNVFGGGGVFFNNYRFDRSENLEVENIRKQDDNSPSNTFKVNLSSASLLVGLQYFY
jgi:hypothetical protein